MIGYIDPGGGLPPALWSTVLLWVVMALGVAWTTLRLWGRRLAIWCRRRYAVVTLLSVLIAVGASVAWWWTRTGQEQHPPSTLGGPRVVVLAFDGMDPQLLQQYMSAGKLPNLQALAARGIYHPLPTTMAPQSPVAWCTCITGTDPGAHGVFDFIKRDPATYRLDQALVDRQQMKRTWQGTPFWDRPTLARLGVVAQRLPMTFPPPKLNGRLLAGMGVWDVRGTEGTYFYFATTPPKLSDARGMILPLTHREDGWHGELPGPYRAGSSDTIRAPFRLQRTDAGIVLRWQEQEHPLAPGRWSPWLSIVFHMGPLGLQKVQAITRVLLHVDGAEVRLYVSPLNFDPRSPFHAISYPGNYAAELAEAVGLYATRGIPFDTHAVNDGVLSDTAFLEQVESVTAESERMLLYELQRCRSGLIFAYFEGSDIVQHLFWRGIDPAHPLHSDAETQQHKDAIPRLYEQYDALLGRVRAAAGPETTIVVMSDHGFGPFRRAVHLNARLRDLGLLVLKNNQTTSAELLRDIDWTRTKAYALGFNALYLNRAGREGQGIVTAADAESVTQILCEALPGWVDKATGLAPIKKVYRTSELYGGKTHAHMPDLLVGYARGYRASWETALGAVPAEALSDNRKKWSGDHCIDAAEVPGIYLSSDRTLDAANLAALGEAIDRYLSR